MRLDQFLVKANICSRSEAKQYIKKGRVSVDGNVWRDSSAHIDENANVVALDGNVITYEQFHYYMLNKPAGCVSATRDGLSATVLDILKNENVKGLFPVGRLDKDTEGLLLITDDGKLSHELLSPRHHVDKTYYCFASHELTQEHMRIMCEGMDIGDEKITLPAAIEYIGKGSRCIMDEASEDADTMNGDDAGTFDGDDVDTLDGADTGTLDGEEDCDETVEEHKDNCGKSIEGFEYLLTIHEGRFHQVKRMFEACDSKILYLKRISMGSLKLDDNLMPGQYRRLTGEEVDGLKGR